MNNKESEMLTMDVELDLSFIEFADLAVTADLQKVRSLAGDKNPELRYRALEKLGQNDFVPIQEDLRRALKDEDDIVRIEAIEILRRLKFTSFTDELISLTSDADELVRAAAVGALGGVGGDSVVNVLMNIVKRNRSELDVAEARFALAKLDLQNRKNWLFELSAQLNSEDYIVRCRVANLLSEIEAGSEVNDMLVKLTNSLKKEKTEAAKSSIQNAINQLNTKL